MASAAGNYYKIYNPHVINSHFIALHHRLEESTWSPDWLTRDADETPSQVVAGLRVGMGLPCYCTHVGHLLTLCVYLHLYARIFNSILWSILYWKLSASTMTTSLGPKLPLFALRLSTQNASPWPPHVYAHGHTVLTHPGCSESASFMPSFSTYSWKSSPEKILFIKFGNNFYAYAFMGPNAIYSDYCHNYRGKFSHGAKFRSFHG